MHRLYPHGTGFFPELVFTAYPKIEPPRALVPMVKPSNIIRHKEAPEVLKYGTPSAALCADGQLLVTYYEYTTKKIYCSRISDPLTIFSVDNTAKNATEYEFSQFTIDASSYNKTALDVEYSQTRSKLFKNAAGDLLLIVYDPGNKNTKSRVQVWKSISGNGVNALDWVLFSTVLDTAAFGRANAFNYENTTIGVVTRLSTGRLIFPYGKLTDHATLGGWVDWQYSTAYSDDDGLTWATSNVQNVTSLSGHPWGVGGVTEFTNCIITKCGYYTGGTVFKQRFAYSLDFGNTWVLCDEFVKIAGEPDGMNLNCFSGVEYNLMFRTIPGANLWKIYKSLKTDVLPLTGQNPYRSGIWTEMDSTTYNNGSNSTMIEKIDYLTVRFYLQIYMIIYQANVASAWYFG